MVAQAAKPGGNQPKRQASKNRVALRKRAREAINLIANGSSAQAAGIKIGYSPTYAKNGVAALLANPAIRADIPKLMEAAGAGTPQVADKIAALMEAKTLKRFGKKNIEISDNGTQLGAATLAARINGMVIERSVSVTADLSPVDLVAYGKRADSAQSDPIDVSPTGNMAESQGK